MTKPLPSLVMAACAALMAGPTLAAQSPLVAATDLVQGTQSYTYEIQATGTGTLRVDLNDLHWLGDLQSLNLWVTDSDAFIEPTTPLVTATPGSGTEELFNVGKQGTYYLHVSSEAGGKYGLGLLSIQGFMTYTAPTVPLPASAWLLAAGLLGLAGTSARRKKTVTCAA